MYNLQITKRNRKVQVGDIEPTKKHENLALKSENKKSFFNKNLIMEINKKKSIKTFPELFNIILTGNKENSRKAARGVRKLLYGSSTGGNYDDIKSIIANAPDEYLNIFEDWREENFVMAVSVLYFLHDRESRPDFLFPWLFHLLQDKNGNVRHAAARMLKNELGPLTVHIRVPDYKQDKSKTERSNFILLNLFISLNNLLVDLWKPAYKKYKYVSSLPTCPYKTIQMVLCEMEDDCGIKNKSAMFCCGNCFVNSFWYFPSKLYNRIDTKSCVYTKTNEMSCLPAGQAGKLVLA